MSCSRFSYQKLKHEGDDYLDDDIDEFQLRQFYEKALSSRSSKSWSRFRRSRNKRSFKLKIPILTRILRRKAKLVSAMRVSFSNIVKRLKESQSHLGDLFAGNYLFLQVTPSSFKCIDHHHYHHKTCNNNNNNNITYNNGFPSRYSIPRITY